MTDLFDEWGMDDDDELEGEGFENDDPEEDDLEDMEPDGDDLDDLDDDELDDLLDLGDDDEEDEDDDEDQDGDDDDNDLEFDDELGSELAGSAEVSCPYCGAGVELIIDPVGGELQEYVEDCEVCCQPWAVRVILDPEGSPSVELGTLDDG